MAAQLDCLATEPAGCAHCGRPDVGTFAAGYASLNEAPLCHPNASGRPDCYRLVTIFRHPMPCGCESGHALIVAVGRDG